MYGLGQAMSQRDGAPQPMGPNVPQQLMQQPGQQGGAMQGGLAQMLLGLVGGGMLNGGKGGAAPILFGGLPGLLGQTGMGKNFSNWLGKI